jgi:PKD repeat protein
VNGEFVPAAGAGDVHGGNSDLAYAGNAASRYGHLDHAGNADLAYAGAADPGPPLPAPPVASFTYAPPDPATTDLVTFDATASVPGPGQVITAYDWLFNHQATRSGAVVTWRLPSGSGSYDATLTVTDSGGGTGSLTQVLAI